ncbi:MAG TPA: response regulator [Kofleriaceae bacterium]|nr:response regulator [Kofleriaceae bacterium]
MSDDDRRSDERFAVALRVDYEDADDLIADYTENLSSGGACVASTREVDIGTEVKLALSFPGLVTPIRVEGIVRWCREEMLGIEFVEGIRAKLETFIERIRSRDPEIVKRTLRVLVVEDNPHIAELLRHGLAGKDMDVAFDCKLASDGRAALELLGEHRFDALIVDIYLPVLDGAGVISAARTKLDMPALPIIAVSGGGDSARRAALAAGANLFIDKPMRLKSLLERIREIMKLDVAP